MIGCSWLVRALMKATILNHLATTLIATNDSDYTKNLDLSDAPGDTSAIIESSPVSLLTGSCIDCDVADMISDFLKELVERDLGHCHPILLTSNEDAPLIVLSVQRRFVSTSPHPLIVYDIESFIASEPPPVPLLVHRASDSSVLYCISFYLMAPIEQVEEALFVIPRTDWFRGSTRYFVAYTGQPMTPKELEEKSAIRSSVNTLFISHKFDHRTQGNVMWPLQLLANCPFCQAGEPEVVIRNFWSPIRGLRWNTDSGLFPDLYRDCNGHNFRSVALSFPPYTYYTEGNSTHPLVLKDCLNAEIVEAVGNFYNFTVDVYEPADGQWGVLYPNGSFTGIVGTVQRLEADFSLGLLVSLERAQAVDLSIDYFMEPLTFVTSKPKNKAQCFDNFFLCSPGYKTWFIKFYFICRALLEMPSCVDNSLSLQHWAFLPESTYYKDSDDNEMEDYDMNEIRTFPPVYAMEPDRDLSKIG